MRYATNLHTFYNDQSTIDTYIERIRSAFTAPVGQQPPVSLMPITTREPPRYQCELDDCPETRTPQSSVAGSYCSRDCANRARAQHLLTDIQQDHRFCYSCFRQRKTIERPTDETRRGWPPIIDDAVIGYEHPTEHVNRGPYGLECTCGAIDHDDPKYHRHTPGTFEQYLAAASHVLVDDGRRDTAIDPHALTYALTDDTDPVMDTDQPPQEQFRRRLEQAVADSLTNAH
jgi:hypothetical protein